MLELPRSVLLVGAGDIGRRVVARIGSRSAVTAVTSDRANRAALRRLGARPLLANLDKPSALGRLPRTSDALIHCAPPPARGSRDTRTRNLLRALAAVQKRSTILSRAIVYLSTSGVYGDCAGARVTESRAPNPANPRAVRRVNAERRLIRAAKASGTRLVILRVPGIYSAERLPLARLKAGTPAIVNSEDSWTNHVHAADLAALVVASLRRALARRRPLVRIYNANDDSDLKMGAYFDLVARTFGLPLPPRLPRAEIESAVSPMLLSFMRESRRLDNSRLKRELRFGFEFPTVAEGVGTARGTL